MVHILSNLILKKIQPSSYPHYINKEMEIQKTYVTYLLHKQQGNIAIKWQN